MSTAKTKQKAITVASMKKVLIVIPTYNEAENIKPLIAAISQVFKRQASYQVELLFVDDNSPDGTSRTIRKLQAEHLDIHLLSGKRAGLGRAYIRGLTHGLGLKSYMAIVMMDADLSHDPRAIPSLLDNLLQGADYVIGSRYVTGGCSSTGYSLVRRLQSRTANFIARQFIGQNLKVKDVTSGFKAIRVSSLETISLERVRAAGYVFQASLLYEFAERHYKITEIPITFHARRHGKSKLGLRDIIEFLRVVYGLNPQSGPRRLLRFAAVGASGTLINLGVLVIARELGHLSIMIAYMIALETSILSNFFLNQRFTFGVSVERGIDLLLRGQRSAKRLLLYNLVSLGGVAISWLFFSIGLRQFRLQYIVADVVAIGVAVSWNYWLSVQVVWPIALLQPELRHEPQKA